MGSETSKLKKELNNISGEELKAFMKFFKEATNGRDRINKDQFMAAYAPLLSEYTPHFFLRMVKIEDCSLVHAKTILQALDCGLGNFDQLVKGLMMCFGDDKEQVGERTKMIMRNVVKSFCEANKFSREDQVRLYEYFEQENEKPTEEMEHFFLSCPLFPYCATYVFNRLLGKPGDSKMPAMSETSKLMGNIDQLVINSFLPFNRRKEWTLLFSSSQHGQSFSQLVKRIDGQGPVMIVLRSMRGRRFGFFASNGFKTGPQYQGSAECFLFQLAPKLKTYNATGRTDNYAYMNYQQQQHPNGIGMGGQGDVWPIFINEDFTTGKCQKNSSHFEPCFIAEEEDFKVKVLEAWRPGPKPEKSFEEMMESPTRTEKSIIDKDPEARAVLEMAGKSMHSEAYRDPAPLLDNDAPFEHKKKDQDVV